MGDHLQYGGQAVIEGVMMRSPRFVAIACRRPDGGITVHEEPISGSILGRLRWLNRPLLRGTLALVDAMVLGMRALRFSASVQAEAIGGCAAEAGASTSPRGRLNDIWIAGTLAFAFVFGTTLFIALPTLMTQLVQARLGIGGSVARNAVDGVIRIAIFLGYIGLISRMENIRRVFQYHGAEHKAINTLEGGRPLVMEACLIASRIHPRCGTSFVIVVLLASILVHSLFPRPDAAPVRIALHTALIPVVAGLAYEIIKMAGRMRNATPLRVLLAPGLWSQRLTTREPDAEQVEVALCALNAVLAREEGREPALPEPGVPAAVA